MVTVSGSLATGTAYDSSTFSASTSVSEGDTLYIAPTVASVYTSPFNSLNQGRFRVIRRFNDSVWFENANVVEEEVLLPYNPVSTGFDTTTTFTVNASDHSTQLIWTGNGTQPMLGNANVGDIVSLNDPSVSSGNTGNFMVLDSGPALSQITSITAIAGSSIPSSGPGVYFTINSAANVAQYYAWFNVSGGTNTDPGTPPFPPAPLIGYTGVVINVFSGDNPNQIALKIAAALNTSPAVGLSASVATGSNIVIVSTTGSAITNPSLNVTVPSPFSVSTIQSGQRTFIELVNPSAVTQSSFAFTSTSGMLIHRPQMQFFEYQATVPGDKFVVTGNALTLANAGTYTVLQVLNQNSMIVSGTLANVMNASISGQVSAVNILEGIPYSGYKEVYSIALTPGTSNYNTIILTTNAQYESINYSSGDVAFTSLNKMNWPTTLMTGLDAYQYNTGLIAEANRIIYGDPRDSSQYPGTGAAGADIFVKEPLALNVKIGLAIRTNSGVPFAALALSVQGAVAALVLSNPVGQSIAISSVISAVSAVPGVLSASITYPNYSSSSDLITLQPSQKAYISNLTSDITVTLIT